MGIKEQKKGSGGMLINYVTKLGGLFNITGDRGEAIAKAIKEAGFEQKEGFMGTSADSKSGKALAALAQSDIHRISEVSGAIKDISFAEYTGDGYSVKKVRVTMVDSDAEGNEQRFNLNLELNNGGVQRLVRKLEQVRPGEHVTLNVFAKYEKSDKDGQMYANPGAMLKVGGVEVTVPESRTAEVKRLSEEVKARAASAKVPANVVGQMVATELTDFHAEIVKSLEQKYQAYRSGSADTHEPAGPDVPADSFDIGDLTGDDAAGLKSARAGMR